MPLAGLRHKERSPGIALTIGDCLEMAASDRRAKWQPSAQGCREARRLILAPFLPVRPEPRYVAVRFITKRVPSALTWAANAQEAVRPRSPGRFAYSGLLGRSECGWLAENIFAAPDGDGIFKSHNVNYSAAIVANIDVVAEIDAAGVSNTRLNHHSSFAKRMLPRRLQIRELNTLNVGSVHIVVEIEKITRHARKTVAPVSGSIFLTCIKAIELERRYERLSPISSPQASVAERFDVLDGRRLMENPKTAVSLFLQRLLLRSKLNGEEQQAILSLSGERASYVAYRDIVSPGETVHSACLVARGLVARYDQMLDGLRQVTSYYIAGDMCDLHSLVVPKASWAITAVDHVSILRIPHAQLRDLCLSYPAIALAFWRDGTVDASIFAKWVGNIGRRNAKARIAHIICEMGMRSEVAGLGERTSFQLNATQAQLSEATGLTAVHVNRTLQDIRKDDLLTFTKGRVEVSDWEALQAIAEFDPAYLLLDGPPQRMAGPPIGGHAPSYVH